MEPKSWKWIQGVVIAAAAVLGVAVAIWYQSRPPERLVDDPVLVKSKIKTRLQPNQPFVTPSLPPASAASGKTASASSPDSPADTIPVPSQSSINSWQKEAVNPNVHLNIPASNPNVASYGLPGAPPMSGGGYLPYGTPNGGPPPYVPSPGGVSAYPSSSPAISPYGGQAVTGADASSASPTTPGSSPVVTGSGTGSVDAGGSGPARSGPGTLAGGAGVPTGF